MIVSRRGGPGASAAAPWGAAGPSGRSHPIYIYIYSDVIICLLLCLLLFIVCYCLIVLLLLLFGGSRARQPFTSPPDTSLSSQVVRPFYILLMRNLLGWLRLGWLKIA